jgi:hypothetical protein
VTASDAERERVLRAFTVDGRLMSMPAKWSKKLVLLDVVAQAFEPGTAYSEKQVDEILRSAIAEDATGVDHVTVRRYLIDADFLGRDNGYYWRTGGTLDVDSER